MLTTLFGVEICTHVLRLENYLVMYVWWSMTWLRWDLCYLSAATFLRKFYACCFGTYWRCNDYFL